MAWAFRLIWSLTVLWGIVTIGLTISTLKPRADLDKQMKNARECGYVLGFLCIVSLLLIIKAYT